MKIMSYSLDLIFSMTKNVKDLARSEEGEAQQKQNNEGGPAKDLLASIMKSILLTGDLMAMTKLLSQKLKKIDNKDLLLAEIGRVETMLMNTITVVGSFDDVGRSEVNKILGYTKATQVHINKMKAILHKVNAAAENVSDILNDIVKESDAVIQSQTYENTVEHVRNLSSAAVRLVTAIRQEAELEDDQIYSVTAFSLSLSKFNRFLSF